MNIWKISTLALSVALGVVIAGPGVQSAAADEQPLMHKALEHLEAAEKALGNANEDKGGHRVKALKLTREAIQQTKDGIKFDNKHENGKDKK